MPSAGNRWKKRATSAAPVVCPSRRAVASMPLAPPLRPAGADEMMMLLFGDWNNPKPNPHRASRQRIAPSVGTAGRQAVQKSPTAKIDSPTAPKIPACTRSTSKPATGAVNTIATGHAVISNPVPTSSRPSTP